MVSPVTLLGLRRSPDQGRGSRWKQRNEKKQLTAAKTANEKPGQGMTDG